MNSKVNESKDLVLILCKLIDKKVCARKITTDDVSGEVIKDKCNTYTIKHVGIITSKGEITEISLQNSKEESIDCLPVNNAIELARENCTSRYDNKLNIEFNYKILETK